MARLHYELLTPDASAGAPRGWLLFTHGIYGSGGNWRSIARRVQRARPELGCVLVDLRNHGRSEAPPPPHDLAACADDVGELIDLLAAEGKQVIAAAAHSFGGKVIATLRQRRLEHASVEPVRQWWLMDSSPSARLDTEREQNNQVRDVLEIMERLPERLPSRAAFESALTDAGQPRSLAQWLSLNLEPNRDEEETFRLRLPLPAIREMLSRYYEADLWDSLRDPEGGDVHVIVAERSRTLSSADRDLLRDAPAHVHVHLVDADHWLHIDAGDKVVELLAANLPKL